MKYKSTRGDENNLTFENVLFGTYSKEGGLYVPEELPIITNNMLLKWKNYTFSEICAEILHLFTDIPIDKLNEMTLLAYSQFNGGNQTLPMIKIEDNLCFLDASYGPTLAFKDIGQQIVAQLLNYYLKLKGTTAKIIVETSGDTGPAAIAGVKVCPNLHITVLYPSGRVSNIQELQMITTIANNVQVYRTEGNSDDQGSVLKELFADTDFVQAHNICSINSINWARIAAQSTYYVWAYLQVYNTEFSIGRPVNFTIPSGAFGNATGGLIAKLMGVPIGKLLCATNKNDIVHRTLSCGDMSIAENYPTVSPAMDIQFAYNLERLLYFISNGDIELVKSFMIPLDQKLNQLSNPSQNSSVENFSQTLPENILNKIHEIFYSYSVSDEQTISTIKEVWEKYHYPLCPHSAVGVYAAMNVYPQLWSPNQNESGGTPMVCVLTAHPSKFPEVFEQATGVSAPELSCFPVSTLSNLPVKYEWLRQYDDNHVKLENWRSQWIEQIKEMINGIKFSSEL